jgi:maltose alpha-D-glucosyltransferase/alpha-amylase
VQGFVRNQGDGWEWTLDFLNRTVEEIAITGREADSGEELDAFSPYLGFAAAIGRRLGELHATLAEPTDDPNFAPLPADAAALRGWAAGAKEQLGLAFALLRGPRAWPDEATERMAGWLLSRKDALEATIDRLALGARDALQTRVHGDFHLGQVLVVQSDAFLIDFEGEPARPMEQRRAKGNGLRDAAGLLRSFDYATAAAAMGRAAASPGMQERRAEMLPRFRDRASAAFLAAYRGVLREAAHPWVAPDSEAALLDLFLIEKAAYEIRYEAANRPAWLGIPVRGLEEIVRRVVPATEETV